MRGVVAVAVIGLLAVAIPAEAIITFTQLDDDVFVVSHRIKGIGSRGRAIELVFEKAASLCVAAGFSHYKVLAQESAAAQEDESANASVQVKLFFEDGEDRMECEKRASREYVAQAREKLAARGYRKPAPAELGGEPAIESANGSCTIEQIAAMAKAGLSDAQIKAACSTGE